MSKLSKALFAATFAVMAGSAFAQSTAQTSPTVGATVNSVEVRVQATETLGYRASKFLYAHVYNENGDKVGNVADIIITPNGGAQHVIVGVGGFLGIDEKLVAVSTAMFDVSNDNKLILRGATKTRLKAMPAFRWAKA